MNGSRLEGYPDHEALVAFRRMRTEFDPIVRILVNACGGWRRRWDESRCLELILSTEDVRALIEPVNGSQPGPFWRRNLEQTCSHLHFEQIPCEDHSLLSLGLFPISRDDADAHD